MILHVVLFRPKRELGPSARRELAAAFSEALEAIGTVRRVRMGRRRTVGRAYEQLMEEDYSHVAILEFEDVAGLRSYLEHPAHERLGAQFFACFEAALMYDFEVHEAEQALSALIADESA